MLNITNQGLCGQNTRKHTCTLMLQHISGLYKRNIITAEKRNELSRMASDGISSGFEQMFDFFVELQDKHPDIGVLTDILNILIKEVHQA